MIINRVGWGGDLNISLWVCFGTMLRKLSMHKQKGSLVMGVCFGTTLKNIIHASLEEKRLFSSGLFNSILVINDICD
jgi:hypothetical protein